MVDFVDVCLCVVSIVISSMIVSMAVSDDSQLPITKFIKTDRRMMAAIATIDKSLFIVCKTAQAFSSD